MTPPRCTQCGRAAPEWPECAERVHKTACPYRAMKWGKRP
jgi:DNA-directed RNA polymerase subunit N (RpoN/RPB10)